MNTTRAFSRVLRLAAVSGALAALIGQNPPAGSAAPAFFQSTPFIAVPNLAAYWNLDETTGTTSNDLSGNNNTGTFWNNPTISNPGDVSPVPVGNQRSLIFNATGSTMRVNVNDSASLRISGPMTVSAWVKPSAYTPSYQKGVIEKWTDGATDIDGYMFRLGWSANGNNVPTFTLGNGTTRLGVAGPPELVNGTWTHVAGVYDGTDMLMYVNGTLVGTTANAGAVVPTAANTRELHLGSDYGTEVFTGNIDDARIYNRGLTAVEVGILKDGQLAPTGVTAAPIPNGNRISWTAPAVPATGISYAILFGASPGNYTGVINVAGGATTYDDLAAPPGVATYYTVVAVTVMTSPNSTEVSSTPGPAGPPPPPPPPRTEKVGNRHMCGCDTVSSTSGLGGLLGAVLMATALGTASRRRRGKA